MSTLGDKTTIDHATASNPLHAGSDPLVSLVLYHRGGAKVVPLGEDSSVVVGRKYPADVIIEDLSLSRQHARFVREGAEVFVEDLGSTNGVRINGQRTERARVGLGDEVSMGAVTAVVQVLAPKDQLAEGLESWDRFLAALEQEVVRSRTFGRPLALVMLRAAQRQGGHVSHWVQKARARARAVDRLSLYGPGAVAAALPELGGAEATAWATAIVQDASAHGLVAGVCVLPDGASSADELLERARTAAQQATREQPVRVSHQLAPVGPAAPADGIVMASPQMREIAELVKKLARSNIPVLIHGETGAGKEVIARALHESGPRQGKPLRTINCAAIPATLIESVLFGHERGAFTGADRRSEGVFEQAHGGTVFLDEIGELAPAAQAALLRVLETKRISRVGSSQEIEVDVRIVAATHRDLEAMCREGKFRLDLLYRLNTMTLVVPPLRDRIEEIEPLARQFLAAANRANDCHVKSIQAEALATLKRYAWPGNVRELRNVIERAVVVAHEQVLTIEDLPERIRSHTSETELASTRMPGAQARTSGAAGPTPAPPQLAPTVAPPALDDPTADFKDKVRRYERDLILDALRRTEWNQTEAAKLLKMPLRTLVHKIGVFNIRKKYEAE